MSTEPIRIGSKLLESVACSDCAQMVPMPEVHCFKGKKGEDRYYCSACKQKIDAALTKETEGLNLKGAAGLGILAGIASGAVWYFVEAYMHIRIGYIAIGAGYLVGHAVVLGSGKKRGTRLQLISGLITLISIVGASYFSTLYAINKYLAEELARQGQSSNGIFWISPFNPDFLSDMISPMTLLIWAFGIYIAFRVPQVRKLA